MRPHFHITSLCSHFSLFKDSFPPHLNQIQLSSTDSTYLDNFPAQSTNCNKNENARDTLSGSAYTAQEFINKSTVYNPYIKHDVVNKRLLC